MPLYFKEKGQKRGTMQNKREDSINFYKEDTKSPVNHIVSNNQSSYTTQSIELNLDEEETKNNLLTLIIDENAVNRLVAKNFLRIIGASIMEAKNARSAIEIILDYPIKLILMDYTMPDMDGLELVARIKGFSGEKACIPIIGMMGNVDDDIKKNFIDTGVVDVIKKPLELTVLQKVINQIFRLENVDSENNSGSESAVSTSGNNQSQVSEGKELEAELKEVINLDCKQGLNYVMEDMEAYTKILKTSVISINECIDHLRSETEGKEGRKEIRELNNVKSILKQAGAEFLAKITSHMEELYDKDRKGYQEQLPVYIEQLQVFKNSLEHALRAYNMLSTDNKKQVKIYKEDKANVINAVVYHAKRFEYKYMLEQIEKLRTMLDDTKTDLLEKAVDAAERFDYDDVVRIIKEIRY